MDYIKKYKNIVASFIKKDFPSLKGEKIIIKEKQGVKWRAHVMYYPWGMMLYMSKRLRKFPEKSVERILFHEMCHLEIFKKDGLIKTNLIYLVYMFSKQIRKNVEAEANILMIQKGRGKDVLTAMTGNKRRGIEYSLTEKEIKEYMEKFGK